MKASCSSSACSVRSPWSATTNFSLIAFVIFALVTITGEVGLASDDELTFEKDIRPLFRAHCFDCHGATEEKEGDLDLRQVRLMIAGGDSGEALVKGDAMNSLLIERIVSGEMPPGDHSVPQQDVDKIKGWINSGAKTARTEPETIPRGLGITQEERDYWAFQPIQRPDVPAVQATDRVRTPIDSFLLSKLETKALSFAPDAEKVKLIRRAYFDLIGLPPTPQQVAEFLADDSPEAWDLVIEKLLSSKHYGERWGRHWLDVAGYADSEGADNSDAIRPWAYRYRDWVIQAFNQDMPWDQFITWQLAGDELVEPPLKNFTESEIDKLAATGFLRMAMDGTGRGNNEENRNAVVRDTIEIVSSSLLGMSVKCAQCHDHRYDPISHEDYFRMRAVFEPALNTKQWRVPNARRVSLYTDADHALAAESEKKAQAKIAERNKKQADYMKLALESVLSAIDEKLREPLRVAYQTPANKRSPEQKSLLKKHPSVGAFSPGVLYQYNQKHADELKQMDADIAKIRAQKPAHEYLRAIAEQKSTQVPKTMLFHRGDYRQPKYEVKPGGLTVCAPEDSPVTIAENNPDLPTTGRRLSYARWLTSGRHPLVARVLVNRFWLHHFGKALVSTPEEFGKLGTSPSHPKLLDWLADEFMAKGWSLKQFHRMILKSTVYRQASTRHPTGNAIDQNDDLYWHFPVRRLEAELIRDSMLTIGNRLDVETQFGAPIGFKEDETGQIVVAGYKQRRSVYLQVRRSKPVSILESFDAPVMKVNCTVRSSTTAATQSLMLMNSKFVLDTAKAFATRINNEANSVDSNLIPDNKLDQVVAKFKNVNPWSYGYGFVEETKQVSANRKLEPKEENVSVPVDTEKVVVRFTAYPRYLQNTWKGSEKLPDPKIGWSFINATMGHPDVNQGATIRRWTSPVSGKVKITGVLSHGSEAGDGVKLTVVSNQKGILDYVVVHHSKKEYLIETDVTKGEVIDTVVASRETNTSDSFLNTFKIDLVKDNSVIETWDSQKDFQGPLKSDALNAPVSKQIIYAWQLAYSRLPTEDEFQLTAAFLVQQFELLRRDKNKQPVRQAMTNFCQSLLSSNEFLYLD